MGAAQLLQVGFFGGLVLSLLGKNVLPENVANMISSNPMGTFGGLLLMNIGSSKLINTGAFEVTYEAGPGSTPIPCWSKLETGHFPTVEVLSQNVRAAAAESRQDVLDNPEAARKPSAAEPMHDEL